MTTAHELTEWTFPVPIRYGPGCVSELGARCIALGIRRPLLVTDRASADLPFVAQALSALSDADCHPALFCGVSPNPTDVDVEAGQRAFRDGAHDAVIGIGGGSGMDGAKAISLVALSDKVLWAFDFDVDPPDELVATDFPPLICIPTTAGTGAETESTAMVTDTAAGVKRCVWHEAQKPKLVLLDPKLTVGLPANLTAWTGCDALVHAIEALSVPAYHPMCDALALEAIRRISGSLERAVSHGDELEARGEMLVGSCLAGVSFLKGLGLVHSISHMVGAVYDTHHGLTNAVLLPIVLRHNAPGLGDKTAMMCAAMGLAGRDFDSLYSAVVALLDTLDIPRNLGALGVESERASELARKAHGDAATGTNAVRMSVETIEAIIREAIVKAR